MMAFADVDLKNTQELKPEREVFYKIVPTDSLKFYKIRRLIKKLKEV